MEYSASVYHAKTATHIISIIIYSNGFVDEQRQKHLPTELSGS